LGEYERTVTTVLNAYVGPLMHDYIGAIVDGAAANGFAGDVLFAHSDGGLVTADFARRHPIITLQSGPVGGVVASANVGLAGDMPNIIATDMGGTTLDVSVIHNGRPSVADLASVEQHAFHLRKVDVESVGAGGGSIAWIDGESNTLRVGPHSAGAVPGPACYGRGGREATVTDADVVLGIIDPQGTLGADLKIDGKAAHAAVGELAKRLGMTVEECAAGIVEIVDSKMEDLVRRVTLQRGHDPRDFQLWAYGGHAGAHATLYARDLGVQTVVVPMGNLASVFSAFGIGTADIVRTREASRHLRTPFDQPAIDTLNSTFAELQAAAVQDCVAMGARPENVKVERTANLKYALQVFEVETPVPDGKLDEAGIARLIANFDAAYEQRYGKGSRYAEAGYALTEVRVRASVAWDRPKLPREAATDKPLTQRTSRQVYWQEYGKAVDTPIYTGQAVRCGHRIVGPAVIEYPHTTVVVRPNQTAAIDPIGNVIIDLSAMAIGGLRSAKQKVAS
ncbi:MAG: hydantoinase/oxoprolinase family protein, partial [Rhizobiaceae bacterium]|nr:hydantoinase/oxoprolinase family protein [Rhizobiaceae bacterium]